MNPSFSAPDSRFDAVICDIDGCLLPETSDPMDAGALTRVAAHNRMAHERRDRPLVTLCSGRPEPFVEAIARLIGVRTLPCIAENGVWLYLPEPHIYEMDPAITPDHLAAVEQARAWVRRELGPIGVVMQPGKTASISLYHPDTDLLMGLIPRIREAFASENWPLRLSTTWYYINCDLEHVTKATALDRLIARAGLDPARLAGIGDTESDHAIADRVAHFGV
jgi:hydroxymethylpyrimidine pyrophosphatase-like HAD family hydrolase